MDSLIALANFDKNRCKQSPRSGASSIRGRGVGSSGGRGHDGYDTAGRGTFDEQRQKCRTIPAACPAKPPTRYDRWYMREFDGFPVRRPLEVYDAVVARSHNRKRTTSHPHGWGRIWAVPLCFDFLGVNYWKWSESRRYPQIFSLLSFKRSFSP